MTAIRSCLLLLLACLVPVSGMAASLEQILEKRYIEFALYENFAPFSYQNDDGKTVGVDVDIARLIADKLGVKAGIRLVSADESVEDDLRNFVWKGHFTAGGVSDVMLHVPYDPNFAKGNTQVAFLQPYYRELVAFAVNPHRVRQARTLDVFTDEPIGVEIESLSDAYLLGAFSGKLRESVRHYADTGAAIDAMVNKEISAVMGMRSQIEYGLSKHEHDYLVTKLPTPGLSLEGWSLGAAVKAENIKLAQRINEILGDLKESGEIEAVFERYQLNYSGAPEKDIITPHNAIFAAE